MPEFRDPLPADRLSVTEAAGVRATESWPARNSFALGVLLFALVALTNASHFRKAIYGSDRPTKPEASASAPILEDLPESLAMRVPALLVRGAVANISILLCIGIGITCVVSQEHRKRFVSYIQPAPARLIPAVQGLDVGVALAASLSSATLFAFLFVPDGKIAPGVYSALALLCGAAGMLVACAALVVLAAWRAGGWHGARGLLPFWTQSNLAPRRSILRDIGLAFVVFVLTNGPLLLSGALNKWLVKVSGMKADQHSLIGELLLPQPAWVLASFLIVATLGAALTEEILFRGGIYNACRRYLGRWTSAILAGLIFSAVHFIRSDFIPLFLMGLIMTWLYERTGRLVASMVFHFANNLIAVLTILALKDHI